MKKIYTLIVLLLSLVSYSQSWQWAKRGGSLEPIEGDYFHGQEETFSLATDSNKNIYGVSMVGSVGLNVDGNPKTNFDTGGYPIDYALFSFACDGTYRWSKIIGGLGIEHCQGVQVDGQNNVYIAGQFSECQSGSFYPPRIDSDIVINQTPQDCRLMFLAKYNDNGVLQWIKRPQPFDAENSNNSNSLSVSFQTDTDGNTYWVTLLPPGSYENGAFVNTMAGSNFFILKYDSDGNYIGTIPIDIQTTGAFGYLRLYRNPYNGYFYIVSDSSFAEDTAIVAGNTITHYTFVSCFSPQGNFQWVREDSFPGPGYFYLYNLQFDTENNIYFGGKMFGLSAGSFLGLSIPDISIPGFVMKTNPDATQVLWSSYNNKGTQNYGGIVLNGNELAYTSYCAGTDFAWGTQTLNASNINNNEGLEVLLARFNKDTGACIALTKIPGSVGFNDVGASITADLSGDYILGGAIGGSMYLANGQQIDNLGSESDFFVAKYATQACSPLGIGENQMNPLHLYPNPTKDYVSFDNSISKYSKVVVYNYLGQVVGRQKMSEIASEVISLSDLSSGVYLLEFTNELGSITLKVVKE
jgi:hypothetical protein